MDGDLFIVTGANSGIGKAVSILINESGGKVIGVARNKERLNSLKENCSFPDNVFIEEKDLTGDIDNHPSWLYELSKKYGKLKGMILSAGIQQIVPLRALSLEKSKELFDLNYFANLFLCKGFCDKRVNIGNGSSIVMISSIASIQGNSGIINYSASKGAINSAVKSLAIEVAKQGIRVNSVLPGFITTEMTADLADVYNEEFLKNLDEKYPLGIGKPEYVADLCCFLVSEKAKWITGQSFVIDGGASLI